MGSRLQFPDYWPAWKQTTYSYSCRCQRVFPRTACFSFQKANNTQFDPTDDPHSDPRKSREVSPGILAWLIKTTYVRWRRVTPGFRGLTHYSKRVMRAWKTHSLELWFRINRPWLEYSFYAQIRSIGIFIRMSPSRKSFAFFSVASSSLRMDAAHYPENCQRKLCNHTHKHTHTCTRPRNRKVFHFKNAGEVRMARNQGYE